MKWLWAGLVVAACGPAAPHTANHTVITFGAPTGSGEGGGSGSGAVVVTEIEPPAPPPPCIPPAPAALDLARVGDDLIVCAVDRAGTGGALGCWDVNSATGELDKRPAGVLAGYAMRDADGSFVVKNGATGDARTAVVSRDGIEIRDEHGSVSPKRALRDAKAAKPRSTELAGDPMGAWFAGDTVYVLGKDGLYLYPIDKLAEKPIRGMAAGGVGVSDGVVVINEAAMSRVTLTDGQKKRSTRGRARHDEPCKPPETYALGAEPDEHDACGAHLAAHYRPYINATVIADGDGFLGIDPTSRSLFTLDDKFAETARVALPTCH